MHVSPHYIALHGLKRNDGRSDCSGVRAITLCVLAVLALAASACGELEPIVEPEIVDLQLTLDTLRTQVRDAQRNLAEVRTELESRRQELADAQVARAQLEGRVREAERRVTEARQVIELQREELVAAKTERERVFRSSSQQLKQLQRRGAKPGGLDSAETEGFAVPTGGSLPWSFNNSSRPATPAINGLSSKGTATAVAVRRQPPLTEIVVKQGDTLYSLARKHRMTLSRLRSLNYLSDDQIIVGQILWVTEN
jgi:LysM repeat protein